MTKRRKEGRVIDHHGLTDRDTQRKSVDPRGEQSGRESEPMQVRSMLLYVHRDRTDCFRDREPGTAASTFTHSSGAPSGGVYILFHVLRCYKAY